MHSYVKVFGDRLLKCLLNGAVIKTLALQVQEPSLNPGGVESLKNTLQLFPG